jgi:dipeptidyl-peptidase-4
MDQWLADQGAIVVAIDNRGTPRRGRSWERSIKGALGPDALDDQVAGLQALGARFPEMDLSRVGIHGWSFGGTMAALAVMCRPDVFHVAVSGAPVVDWLDYDTHYTERYLDLPEKNPAGYERSSPLFHAESLQRPLLLIHGTADDNVYFSHSCKLASALTHAGRSFEFLPLPGVTHQVGDPLLRQRVAERTAAFLLSHLR